MALTLDLRQATLLFPPAPEKLSARAVLKLCAGAALDLLFPPHCASCARPLPGAINKSLCRSCADQIAWIGPDRCRRCGDGVGFGSGVVEDCPTCRTHPPAFVQQSCSVTKYATGPVRDLVLSLKFGGKMHVAKLLGTVLAQRIQTTGLDTGNLVLVPAPLTRRAMRRRLFNQAAEIALWAGKALRAPVEARLLRKIRSTVPQATLSHEKRRTNLKGAFVCNEKIAARHRDKCILLIDDVITTGSTISECARMLHEAGITQIRAASFARG
jgi:ComF family protein